MSDLMNSIKIFVTDPEGMTPELIETAVSKVSGAFDEDMIPVLLYPFSIAETIELVYEKSYILWVLNMDASDHYFTHLRTMLKTTKH